MQFCGAENVNILGTSRALGSWSGSLRPNAAARWQAPGMPPDGRRRRPRL